MVPVTDMLVDPITRKKFDIESPYSDKLLRMGPLQKFKLDLQQSTVALPKTILQGLRGDSQYTLTDFLHVSSIPYYLGGLFLVGSFVAGGDRVNAARQGVGVLLYYLGVMAANKGVDQFYKWHTGVDLDLRYRKSNGDIEKVYASADFPRMDLLSHQDYEQMAKKMGVPVNVADPKREVNDQARLVAGAARFDKLILGNLLAAIGAGYIARSDAWARLLKDNGAIRAAWNMKDKQVGNFGSRLKATGQILWSKMQPALQETVLGGKNPLNLWLRRGVLGSVAMLGSLIFYHGWRTLNRSQRNYESPFISNLSPELAPEQSAHTAALQRHLPGGTVKRLPRQGAFEIVQSWQPINGTNNYTPDNFNGLSGGFRL
jgi:hypothetical protein